MTELQRKKFKRIITQEADLQYAKMHKDLHLVKCTRTDTVREISGKIADQDIRSKEGFASTKELQSLLRQDEIDLDDIPSVGNYIVLKKEHREHLRLNGPIGVFNPKTHPPKVAPGRLMDALREGEWSSSDLFREYRGDVIKGLDGRVIPVALFGSGFFGGFNEKNYDLSIALEVLKARPDVRIVREEQTGYKEITHDPYANYDHICFRFSPSDELAQEISGMDQMDVWKVILERDLLGLDAAGATLAKEAISKPGNGP